MHVSAGEMIDLSLLPQCDVGEQCAVRKGARIGKMCDCPRGAFCNFFLLKCLWASPDLNVAAAWCGEEKKRKEKNCHLIPLYSNYLVIFFMMQLRSRRGDCPTPTNTVVVQYEQGRRQESRNTEVMPLHLLLFLLHPTEREMEWLCRRGCVCHEESVQPVQSHLPLLAGQWQERPSLGLDWRARASEGWTLGLEAGQGTEQR